MRDIFRMSPESERMPTMTTQIIDLGPGNQGAIGPKSPEEQNQVEARVNSPEYVSAVDKFCVCCIDGRFKAEDRGGLYPMQIAGSEPVSRMAADLMLHGAQAESISKLAATRTKAAVDHGVTVFVHGDDHAGESGCAANAKLRQILTSAADNADTISALTAGVAEAIGLPVSDSVNSDVHDLIVNGAKAADKDSIWDATPAQLAAVMLKNGANYQEFEGAHLEDVIALTTDPDTTFNGTLYSVARQAEAESAQAFVVSMGAFAQSMIERDQKAGHDESAVMSEVLAVIAFQVAAGKFLGNKNLQVALLKK